MKPLLHEIGNRYSVMALRDHSLELNAPEQCKAALQGESMRNPQADFGYMYTLLEDFFKRSNIRSALRVIADQTITGWEVWFQVEFARFLAEHESEPEWGHEYAVQYGWRKEKHRYYFKPDAYFGPS